MLTLTVLLVAHFAGDFLLQSDWMATNKSKKWDALAIHVSVYTAAFVPFVIWQGDQWMWASFLVVTWVAHFLTDAATSRATSKLWFFRRADGIWAQAPYTAPQHSRKLINPWVQDVGNRHWFFVMIGFDQLIHAATLAVTFSVVHG
jgi:hypothetical protein